MKKRTYTIAEAADLTGLSRKAIARRIERGSLQSLVRGGRRMVPHAELVRTGLIPESPGADEIRAEAAGLLSPQDPPGGAEGAPRDLNVVAALMRELVDRLERQAGEIAHFRAISAQAESLRLEREIGDLRSRLSTLEGQGARPELPHGSETLHLPPHLAARAREGNGQTIWLPPSATAASETHASRRPPAPTEPRGGWEPTTARVPRFVGFVLEALFIVAVAAGAWLADVEPVWVVAAVAGAWACVAILEWIRWANRCSFYSPSS